MILLVEPVSETLREPVTTFVLLLAIVLIIPPLFERLRLPGLVGLLVAGVLFGSSGLGWLRADSETMTLFSEIGKIYLMFVAGLEIDLALFQKTRNRSIAFGFATFVLPLMGGIAVGLVLGYGWLAAVLIGSLLASHTLLAYPIVQRLGVVSNEAVTVTVGATIFTDVAALILLAVCLGISQGDFSGVKLLTLLGALVLYAIAVLVGLKVLGQAFFRRTGKDEGNQFLFVMLSVFLSALGAQLIGVENIIGAFLAGLAINGIIGDGPVKEKTEFLGSVLFIPMFFVAMGLLLDLNVFESLLSFIEVPLLIVATLLVTKFLAAFGAGRLFGYQGPQIWTMWSLSVPQVAATLAAALVGYEAEIINAQVFNSVILLMLLTAILGPLVTARVAPQLVDQESIDRPQLLDWLPTPSAVLPDAIPKSFSVVVPVYNPDTERSLLELAAAVARYENGRVTPLAIALAQPHMDSPQLSRAIARSRERLEAAQAIGETFDAPFSPKLRIEYSVAQAICHVSREEDANLIILGMGPQPRLGVSLTSTIQDEVLWSAHCPVIVAQLRSPLSSSKRILVPVETPSPLMLRSLRFAQVLATANQAEVTLLHVCSPRVSQAHRAYLQSRLESLVARLPTGCPMTIQLLPSDSVVSAIAKTARSFSLVVLRLQRRRAGSGFTLGEKSSPLLKRLTTSVILVGEPHPQRLRLTPWAKAASVKVASGKAASAKSASTGGKGDRP
ncbi:MAG: cation:proton antiporter [Elainellaceae cyanobacterium]